LASHASTFDVCSAVNAMALDETAVEPASQRTLTTLSKEAKLVTFIDVFTVEPANQQRLVELLAGTTETSVVNDGQDHDDDTRHAVKSDGDRGER
jgi:hypothetical protein